MSLLDKIFSLRLFNAGEEMIARKGLNLIGADISDNEINDRVDVTVISPTSITALLALKADKKLTYVAVTGMSKTLTQADAATIQECTNANPVAITVPSLEAGTAMVISQIGAGKVSLTASGVTFQLETGYTAATRNQFVDLILRWRTTTLVQVTGALST